VRLAAVRGAEWDEFEEVDWTGRFVGPLRPTWRVPAARMKLAKAKKADSAHDHLVPLSREAVEVLLAARQIAGGSRYTFAGRNGAQLGEGAIGALYASTRFHGRHVPHGWRATFSTLLNERFPADRALIDRALAHAGKDKVEAAYNRAEHLGRRRWLFQAWGEMLA
jgi:integrase